MRRLFAMLMLVGVGALAHTNAQERPATRPAGPLLRINVVALDRDDKPVDDLRKEDLEVWIGGYRPAACRRSRIAHSIGCRLRKSSFPAWPRRR